MKESRHTCRGGSHVGETMLWVDIYGSYRHTHNIYWSLYIGLFGHLWVSFDI